MQLFHLGCQSIDKSLIKNTNILDAPSSYHPCVAKVHFLRPEVILFSPSLRKLVNESNGVFLAIQKLHSVPVASDLRPEMLKYSKQYRSILRACVEELQDLAEKCTEEKKSIYENFQTIFYNVECVWHLTEILYVDVIPGKIYKQKFYLTIFMFQTIL